MQLNVPVHACEFICILYEINSSSLYCYYYYYSTTSGTSNTYMQNMLHATYMLLGPTSRLWR